jgi:hypothetical protein
MKEANFQDEVKHRTGQEVGVVIAKYEENVGGKNIQVLDIRTSDERIRYATPAKNWEVAKEYEP